MSEADMNQKTYGSNFGLKINGKAYSHSHQTQNNEKYFLGRQNLQNTVAQLRTDSLTPLVSFFAFQK